MTHTVDRGDGRIEILCKHGVGHPSKQLSQRAYNQTGRLKWADWMGVHGCDGCCCQAEFALMELEAVGKDNG